jgi:predicted GNAT superfamily acetyltransferase
MEAKGPAWDAAHRAAAAAGVSLVPMVDMDDAIRVCSVVGRVWGEDELRPSLARALQHAGTGVYGALDGQGKVVGFVLGFLGWDGGLHLHSHMLGVVPEWQSRGVGYALKLSQRAASLGAGLDEVRWTYDPLVARNAWFNLVKLGTLGTAYLEGFYGEMSDRINRGDRSDRFEVRWRLASDRVERAIAGRPRPPSPGPVLLAAAGEGDAAGPRETQARPEPGAVVEVPADHVGIRNRDPGLGREWREATGRVFRACFDAGLVASWIDREGRYVFTREDEEDGG